MTVGWLVRGERGWKINTTEWHLMMTVREIGHKLTNSLRAGKFQSMIMCRWNCVLDLRNGCQRYLGAKGDIHRGRDV